MLPVVHTHWHRVRFLDRWIGGLPKQVFNLNGLGQLFVDSVGAHDYAMTQTLVMLVVLVFVTVNLFYRHYLWLAGTLESATASHRRQRQWQPWESDVSIADRRRSHRTSAGLGTHRSHHPGSAPGFPLGLFIVPKPCFVCCNFSRP